MIIERRSISDVVRNAMCAIRSATCVVRSATRIVRSAMCAVPVLARIVVACTVVALIAIPGTVLHAQSDTAHGSWLEPSPEEARVNDSSRTRSMNLDSSDVTVRMPSPEAVSRFENDDAFDYGREYRKPDSFFKRMQRAFLEWLAELFGNKGAATAWDIITYILSR